MFSFASVNDFVTYLNHPAHVNFYVNWFLPCVSNAIGFDYVGNDIPTLHSIKQRCHPLRHLVLFNYKADISLTEMQNVEKSFTLLPANIPEIKNFEWGPELKILGLEQGFEDGFLLTFNGYMDYFKYVYNPLRIQFYNTIAQPALQESLIVDYYVRKK